jgi:hypothetical protein
VHGELKQFLIVLTTAPAFLLHHLDEMWQSVGIVVLRVAGEEFQTFLLGEFYDSIALPYTL